MPGKESWSVHTTGAAWYVVWLVSLIRCWRLVVLHKSLALGAESLSSLGCLFAHKVIDVVLDRGSAV